MRLPINNRRVASFRQGWQPPLLVLYFESAIGRDIRCGLLLDGVGYSADGLILTGVPPLIYDGHLPTACVIDEGLLMWSYSQTIEDQKLCAIKSWTRELRTWQGGYLAPAEFRTVV